MFDRRYVWIAWGATHLVVAIYGACYALSDRDEGPAAQAIGWYATMSGADSSFGFFAPVVGAPTRARFLLQDAEGSTWWDGFDHTSSPEARLRLIGIVDYAFMSGDAQDAPEWRRHLVKSWAATMFTRNPSAVSQTVVVEAYIVPSMADYRAGSRPSWHEVYRAEIQRESADLVGEE